MTEIPLEANPTGRKTRTKVQRYHDIVAIVDTEDAERVLARRWRVHKTRTGTYVRGVGRNGQFLHRFVLALPPWRESRLVVDHINHDPLDNRRSNLRAVKNVLNLANAPARRTAVYSLHKGVTFDRRGSGRWVAQILIDRKHIHLGSHKTEEAAALAYNAAALKVWGEHAYLNTVVDGPLSP